MQVLKEEINESIKAAAIKEFTQKGFRNASLRKIAADAGISVSNLYNYHASKEDLFYSMSDPVYHRLKKIFGQFIEQEQDRDFHDKHFAAQFSRFAAGSIASLIKESHGEFIMIMDRSEGTKYAKLKTSMIAEIEEHFTEHVKSGKNVEGLSPSNLFIMHLIAANLIESMLEIARHYKNNAWVDENMALLMKYHFNGINQFL